MSTVAYKIICDKIRKLPVIKWYQTDRDRLAAVNKEALYKFVRQSQQGRREPMIVIAEMFPFDKTCAVYIPSSLKCLDCTANTQTDRMYLCQLGSIRASVSHSALRILNNEIYLTRQEFYTSIKQSLEVLDLKFIEAIFI